VAVLRALLAGIGLALILAFASHFLPLSRETNPLLAPSAGRPTTAPGGGQELAPSSQFAAAPQPLAPGLLVIALALLPALLAYIFMRR